MHCLGYYNGKQKGVTMEEYNNQQLEQLLQIAPGGILKLAFDDMLTILYATDSFYSLIKNLSSEVVKTPLSLLRIIYSADVIYVTQQHAEQKRRKDNMLSLNFRTLQNDGCFKWVMITGNKTQETYQSGTKTVPVYSCVAQDITYHMREYKKLEQNNDYHNKIAELSKDLYFEYEIAKDTLSFSELFREIFGKDAVLQNFRERLEKTKMIHASEQPAVFSIYNSMMSGRKLARFELRLITKDDKPIWYICYAAIIFDENRNPYKVVGKLATTNHMNSETEKTVYAPQLDPLTNVCTKESAEQLITDAITKQEEDSLSALFIVDIRNYKNLNEIRKNINGKNVLTIVGENLKDQFRESDIIGRYGMNEFVVYMKDIHSDSTVYEKADQLCRMIEAIYSYEHTKNGITTSIGVSLQKGSQEYQTMLANANTALVMAKKVPISSFEVFSGTIN